MSAKLNQLKLQLGRILTGLEQHTENAPQNTFVEKEGVEIIGVVTHPMARSLFSFQASVQEYHGDYISAHGLDDPKARKKMNAEELEMHLAHVEAVGQFASVVHTLCWITIGQEVGEVATDKRQYAIHEGWQISAKKFCNCPACTLRRAVESGDLSGLSGVAVVELREKPKCS